MTSLALLQYPTKSRCVYITLIKPWAAWKVYLAFISIFSMLSLYLLHLMNAFQLPGRELYTFED